MLNLSKGSGLPLSTNDYQLANDFGKLFAQKIADIRSDIRSVNTNQICLPNNATSTVTPSCFSEFNLLSESEVFDLITASSKKSCPTKLVVESLDHLLPVITKMINSSLIGEHFPKVWKQALIDPRYKKAGINDFTNLRPVSKLQYVSKLVEHAGTCTPF